MHRRRIVTAAFATVFCALGARATSPSVTPSSGELGSTFSLDAPGVRVRRSTIVRLVPQPGQTGLRSGAVKIVDASGGEDATVRVVRGRAGVYDVVVAPGGKRRPIKLPDTFTILAPSVASIDPLVATIGTSLEIKGAHFGPAEGKEARKNAVTIGGHRAHVVTWSDDAITCQLPVDVHAGRQAIVVSNGAGPSTEDAPLRVTPPGDPPEFLRMDVDGVHFEALGHGGPALTSELLYEGKQVLIDANPGTDRFTLVIDFPKLSKTPPYQLGGGVNPDGERLAVTWIDLDAPLVGGPTNGSPLTFTVTGWADGVLEGTFAGSYGPAQFANGAFRVHLDVYP